MTDDQSYPETSGLRHLFRSVDDLDWEYLLSRIGDGGRDRFWKTVIADVRSALSCGAEPNRHSGAVGAEKRAEQSNPGGCHEVASEDDQKPHEQKAAGMNPRPAASSCGVAQGSGGCGAWQPIETAPKDGTRIIGSFWSIRWADSHRKGDVVGCWYQPEFDAFISSCREMSMHNGYTFEDGATKRLHSPVIEPITHWMPMPDGPAVPSTNCGGGK